MTSQVYYNLTLINLNFVRFFYQLSWSMYFSLVLTDEKVGTSRKSNFWIG
jgi:hypothetical protein